MRLIDIDHHFKINEAFYRADIEMPLHRVKTVLEYEPTIEAIPIGWLDSYCTDCSIELRDNDAKAIIKLVEDWRQENGKD